MDVKDFAKYVRGKSIDKLFTQPVRNRLNRILASEKELTVSERWSLQPSERNALVAITRILCSMHQTKL